LIEHAPVLPGAIEFAYSRLSEGEPEYIADLLATCIAALARVIRPLFVDARRNGYTGRVARDIYRPGSAGAAED